MNVLSLFDGMSCGQIALERAGIQVDKYFASEIDKYAIKVTMANYPNTIQIGDVVNVTAKDLPKIDLLIGGSPCQGFSRAGKGLNFEDPRSKLFFEYVRILKECLPCFFILENVRMGYQNEAIINKILGTRPMRFNSSIVSAQNRERLYWTNIPVNKIPANKNIVLDDILERETSDLYNLSDAAISRIIKSKYSKAKIYPRKTGTIMPKNNSGQLCVDAGTTLIKVHSLQPRNGKGVGGKGHLEKQDGKSYCLDTSQSQCIEKNGIYRRLTELEYERLQTVPDNYTNHVSSTQRYKMLGNGWTVDIITHILKHIPK